MMRLLQRWTTTITASLNSAIGQLENHEALVEGAIREIQEHGARARVQLARVKRDGDRFRKRLVELAQLEALWKDRAISVHESDKAKALGCVRRQQQVQREIAHLQSQRDEHEKIEAQLSNDLANIQQRIDDLKRKKHLYAAKQGRQRALNSIEIDDLGLIGEIDDIFNHWEDKLAKYESVGESSRDALEDEFRSREEEVELEQILSKLVEAEKQ